MLQYALPVWLYAILGDVRNPGDERMCCRAVITLVVVLDKTLPVGIQVHIPFMIVNKLLREVKLVHPFTLVDIPQLILPPDTGLLAICSGLEIHPHKPSLVDMDMHGEEAMLAFVEALDSVEPRRLGKVSLEAVRPAVVFATQDAGCATALLDYRVRPVATDIVEPVDIPAAVTDEEEREVGIGERNEIAGFRESKIMCDEDPFLRKDAATFQLIHGRRAVP